MASRSKLYFTLALCFNCFILTFLILDSRSFNTLDINLGLLPETWDEPWLKSGKEGGEQLYLHELSLEPEKEVCGMCTANTSLCNELGYVSQCVSYLYQLIHREAKLSQAIWNRGTEARLKRFLAKAKRGEGFTVGVVGGSGKSHPFQYHLTFPISKPFTAEEARSSGADWQYQQDTVFTNNP